MWRRRREKGEKDPPSTRATRRCSGPVSPSAARRKSPRPIHIGQYCGNQSFDCSLARLMSWVAGGTTAVSTPVVVHLELIIDGERAAAGGDIGQQFAEA